jgi:hypothetical protein
MFRGASWSKRASPDVDRLGDSSVPLKELL